MLFVIFKVIIIVVDGILKILNIYLEIVVFFIFFNNVSLRYFFNKGFVDLIKKLLDCGSLLLFWYIVCNEGFDCY